jgi:hypothetical protein
MATEIVKFFQTAFLPNARVSAALRFVIMLFLAGMSVEAGAQGTIRYFVAGPENSEGDQGMSYPFVLPNGRLQQFYGLQGSSSLSPAIEILSVAFRIEGNNFDTLKATYNKLTVTLSTTPATPNQINSVFAFNPGPDASVVFDGPITFNAPPSQGPAPFNIVIDFTRPYLYNSELGNLLLEITHDGSSTIAELDAIQSTWPSVGGSIDAFGGRGIRASILVVTKFGYTVVPEPSPTVIFGLLAVILVMPTFRKGSIPFR